MVPRILYSLPAVLLVVGCVVAGGCGWEEAPRVSMDDVVGTWVLDRDATSAALLAAVDALDGDDQKSGTTLRIDPKELPERVRDLQGRWRRLRELVLSGEVQSDMTFKADGTFSGTITMRGEMTPGIGTWTLDEGRLAMTATDVPEKFQSEERYRDGAIESLDPFSGLTLWVFRRQQDEPAR